MRGQLALPLMPRLEFKREDFFVSPCNSEAFFWVENPKKWPMKMLFIYGEKGCGKTHLAHLFSSHILKARCLTEEDIPAFPTEFVLEDIDEIQDETVLFHAFNFARENGISLLMTGQRMPFFKLPDLQTRMHSITSVAIHAPDDTLILSILCKLFNERQVQVEPDVMSYLLKHLERTYDALRQVVEKVDVLSLQKKHRITIPLLKEALDEIQKAKLL